MAHSLGRRELLTAVLASSMGALASSRLHSTPLLASGAGHFAFALDDEETEAEVPRVLIPPRRAGALGARELLASLEDETMAFIEERLVEEMLAGNVPSFLRRPVPIALDEETTVWALRDYLAVGSDDDWLRLPFSAPAAQRLVTAFGAVLPTPPLVDAIYRAADVKLSAIGLNEPIAHRFINQALEHERRIAAAEPRGPFDALCAGHKKDIVVSPILRHHPGKVAIYGFFLDGEPLQPLSTIHLLRYVDYSHGVRLLADAIDHRGERHSLRKAMADSRYAGLLGGPVDLPAYPDTEEEAQALELAALE